MSVPSSNAPVVENKPVSSGKSIDKDDVIELLGEESPEEDKPLDIGTPKKSEKPEKEGSDEADDNQEDSKDDEDDELKAIEEELEGPKEEDLEFTTPVRRREILKKYPNLFKDFPYLEKAYYREQQFTELLPTIDDAKMAVEKAQTLDNFEREIMDGNIQNVLKAVKQEDSNAFNRLVDGYMDNLRETDQGAYYHVLSGVIKDTIITMSREARSMGEQGQPLLAAAQILNQFAFGSSQFQPHRRLAKQDSKEESGQKDELKLQQEQIFTNQFESTKNDLQTRADNVLKSTIAQHIDPKESMTDYVRKNASREAFEMLENLMEKDTRFHSILDKLWERAFEQKFSKESTDRIKSAYLAKAKTLLPSVIKKARNDALRGLGKRVREDDEQEESTPKTGPIRGEQRPAQRPSGKIRKAADIPKGMSTLDVLMQD